MAKFKIGDKVKIVSEGDNLYHRLKVGMTGIVAEDSTAPFVFLDGMTGDNGWCVAEDSLELIIKTTPKFKVGDMVRHVKSSKFHTAWSERNVDAKFEVKTRGENTNYGWWYSGTNGECAYSYDLELVPETTEPQYTQLHPKDKAKFVTGGIGHWHIDAGATISNGYIETLDRYKFYQTTEPIKKPNTITKMTNFIKKLTQSADDKALEKAGFVDTCGDLTRTGNEALTSFVFAEKKEALVKLANEMIAEAKE